MDDETLKRIEELIEENKVAREIGKANLEQFRKEIIGLTERFIQELHEFYKMHKEGQ